MTFCNVSQFKAKRLLKTSIEQVEQVFKSSAYFGWNTLNIDTNLNLARRSSTPSIYKSNQDKSRNRYKGAKSRFTNNIEVTERDSPKEVKDQTIIPDPVERDTALEHCADSVPGVLYPMSSREGEESLVSASSEGRMDSIFPASGLILNELYQLYNSKSDLNEKNSAIINYIRLIFQNTISLDNLRGMFILLVGSFLQF